MTDFRQLCLDILNALDKGKVKTQAELNKLKLDVVRQSPGEKFPNNVELLNFATKQQRAKYKALLTIKPTRTLSGVNVIAIMTKPMKCPHVKKGIGPCAMCPGGPGSHFGDVPQSYTGKEPATLRAIRNKYDPYLQVFNRLEQYCAMNKLPEKVELIIMGGTFPSFPIAYQDSFIIYAFKAMNDFSQMFFRGNKLLVDKFLKFFELPGEVGSLERIKHVQKKVLMLKDNVGGEDQTKAKDRIINKNKASAKIKNKNINNITSLEQEQKRNEKSKIKVVGMTIETRPDYATLKHAEQMLRLGATRVELGVQSVFDDVLKSINRGHSVQDSVSATKTLKDLGFKINYHMMLGLPNVDVKKDLASLKQLFTDSRFRPDMLKLYPCMVMKGTKLYDLWKNKKFKPISTEQAVAVISEIKKSVPKYVRIMRVQRDIPTYATVAGVDKTNLRQMIQQKMKQDNAKCRCIRCREPGRNKVEHGNIKYCIMEYAASEGKEFFVSAEDKANDCIIGFVRLRFPAKAVELDTASNKGTRLQSNTVSHCCTISQKSLPSTITKDSALIRELHVYGETAKIGEKGEIQHRGYGKQLLKIAEDIAHKHGRNKIVVISGIGVREYYKKLGYNKQGPYMVKKR